MIKTALTSCLQKKPSGAVSELNPAGVDTSMLEGEGNFLGVPSQKISWEGPYPYTPD